MSKTPATFYKTIINFEVLSEDPLPGHADLDYILQECRDGSYVGRFGAHDEISMEGKEMAQELVNFGSEPGFFEIELPEDVDQ